MYFTHTPYHFNDIFLSSEKANRARTPEEEEEEVVVPKITYTMTIYSLAELLKPQARREPNVRFVVLASDLEWPDVQAQLKIKAIDVLFPQLAVVDDASFEIEFSIARQVPTAFPLLSENDYKYLVQNALKSEAQSQPCSENNNQRSGHRWQGTVFLHIPEQDSSLTT